MAKIIKTFFNILRKDKYLWLVILMAGLIGGLIIGALVNDATRSKFLQEIIDKKDFLIAGITIPLVIVTVVTYVTNFLRNDRESQYDLERDLEFKNRMLQNAHDELKRNMVLDDIQDSDQNWKKTVDLAINHRINMMSQESIIDTLRQEFKKESILKLKFELIEKDINKIQSRIFNQTKRLDSSSKLNLSIAIATTVLVLFFLIWSLFTVGEHSKNYTDFLIHFVPRLSLSIILEIFAYFFLRLYTKNLDEIKYWNNELTNIEMKSIGIKTTILEEIPANLHLMSSQLLETERNFILKKHESTVEIEKEKINERSQTSLIDALTKILDKK